MTSKLNKKTLDYLYSLKLTQNTRIIVTDLEKVLFDSKNFYNNKEKISIELLKYLLSHSSAHIKQLTKNKTINIFNNSNLNKNITSQLIVPINTKSQNIHGSIILINYNNTLDKSSVKLIYTIKQNIQFYSNVYNVEEIKKYENNPLYNKKYTKHISSLLINSIDEIFIDNGFKEIDELTYYKIDSLKNKLNTNDCILLDNILNLLEKKKEYYALYAIALGLNYKNIN